MAKPVMAPNEVAHVELQAMCNSLGYSEKDPAAPRGQWRYTREPDCDETVRELIRSLRHDDETCDVRRELGRLQVVQKDLVPILKTCDDGDTVLFDIVIRLLINLTQPARICFKNEIPQDRVTRNQYLEVEAHLQAYKETFADSGFYAIVGSKLRSLLALDWESRREDDRLLIERILVLLRNILHVPPTRSDQLRTDDDASTHDKVLWAMLDADFDDLLVYLTCSDDERQFAIHCLEIVSLMFREQTAEQLASAGVERHAKEKEKDQKLLAEAVAVDKARKTERRLLYSTRHSRFGGTFVMKGVKSIGDQDVIYHRPLSEAVTFTFDSEKQPRKKPKNRQPITEEESLRRSTLKIRVGLREFCVQFLENCYNPLMRAVKAALQRDQAQEHDETYYLWAVRFFMEFARIYRAGVEVVSETMSLPTFHYIQMNLTTYYDMTALEKRAAITWSRRLHLALRAYRELLLSLCDMEASASSQLRESARVLKNNIMYMMEYREIFQLLLKHYDNTKQSRAFLRDLAETTHIYVKLMESWCKSGIHVVVQVKRRRRKDKRRRREAATATALEGGSAEGGSSAPAEAAAAAAQQLDDRWEAIADDLSAAVQGDVDLPNDAVPFDAASEVDVEQQRVDCMRRVHEELRSCRPAAALALLRAAREVWPEKEEFGTADMDPEEEFMALRKVFYADVAPAPGASNRVSDAEAELAGVDEADDGEEDAEAESEELESVQSSERQFDFKEFIMGFANARALRSYTLLLADYRTNSTHINHCAVKMLHRLAVGCDMHGMLYQLSLFRVFQKIFGDPCTNTEHFKEVRQFACYILRKFVEVASADSRLFVEMLFWKSIRESVEVANGYGTYKADRHVKQQWTEEQDMELRRLFEQFKDGEPAADGAADRDPSKDVVDLIMENRIDETKTRRQVVRQLVHLELLGCAADARQRPASGQKASSRVWQEEDEAQLRQLFEEHRESDDVVGNILDSLSKRRSRPKVIEKILSLGLVGDRRELYKKRRRKAAEGDEEDDDGAAAKRSKTRRRKRLSSAADGEDDGDVPSDDGDEASFAYETADALLDSTAESGDDGDGSSDENRLSAVADLSGDRQTQPPIAEVDPKAMLRALTADGLAQPVQWLRSSLRRVAVDRRSGDNEPMPLVPLTPENEAAMEREPFLALLTAVGLQRPVAGQEMFWRIPTDLQATDLLAIIDGLDPDSDAPLPAWRRCPAATKPRKLPTPLGGTAAAAGRRQQMAVSAVPAGARDSQQKRRAAMTQLAKKVASAGGRPAAQKRKARAAQRESEVAVVEATAAASTSGFSGSKRTAAKLRLGDSSDEDGRLLIDETGGRRSSSSSSDDDVPLLHVRRSASAATAASAAVGSRGESLASAGSCSPPPDPRSEDKENRRPPTPPLQLMRSRCVQLALASDDDDGSDGGSDDDGRADGARRPLPRVVAALASSSSDDDDVAVAVASAAMAFREDAGEADGAASSSRRRAAGGAGEGAGVVDHQANDRDSPSTMRKPAKRRAVVISDDEED